MSTPSVETVYGGAGVLEVTTVADAEAHARRLPGDPEQLQQALKVGVVAIVEDDEPGVDIQRPIARIDTDRVRVPPGVITGLEHSDFMPGMQHVGHYQAGNPGTDDRDPWRGLLHSRVTGLRLLRSPGRFGSAGAE